MSPALRCVADETSQHLGLSLGAPSERRAFNRTAQARQHVELVVGQPDLDPVRPFNVVLRSRHGVDSYVRNDAVNPYRATVEKSFARNRGESIAWVSVDVMKTFSSLPEPIRDELRARVDRDGANTVSAAIGLPVPTLARALAGLPVRRGTVALVRLGLLETSSVTAA